MYQNVVCQAFSVTTVDLITLCMIMIHVEVA